MRPAITPRQREVVDRLAQGLTYREIARALGIAPKTVRVHVQAVAAHLPGPGGPQRRVLRCYLTGGMEVANG